MKKILIADDDEAIVNTLVEALDGQDRTIRRAHDGKSALNWLGKERFDLVICDLMMPTAHGFQVLEHIRANPDLGSTRIIVLSAKSYKRDAEQARKAGADLFISKPYDLAELQKQVTELLAS